MTCEPEGPPPSITPDEMSRVMAAHDWSSSPVGPPDAWPPLLKTMVRVVQTSRFSMWMGWGPELAFFYNDAYARDTLGVKHPWALGRPAAEVWSEVWDDVGPRAEAVLQRGAATWDHSLLLFLERSGYREETYHTFSYSPICDFDEEVVGLLCVVTEETQRVIGERRMATLRDLAAQLSTARGEADVYRVAGEILEGNLEDLPFTVTYMLGPDGAARLSACSGVRPGEPVAPLLLPTGGDASPWPLEEVLDTGRTVMVDDLAALGAEIPAGGWPDPARQAVMVPLIEGARGTPTGVFVAGLNPFRAVDPEYRGFAQLVAGSIAAAVASARAFEGERRRAESLAELDRAKTEFFSNVSHEFRTPLTLIIAPADDALRDDLHPLPEPQRGRLEVIARNARRLRRLVNDMLDFARIEGGRLRAEREPTDLASFTRDVAQSFAPAIERSGVDFEMDVDVLERPVSIDRSMWEKIVLNLLSNALKFTLDGCIRLELRGDEDGVRLAVSDTGVGIPSEHLHRLFERFYRAPRTQARSHEGTGIGLALVAELVRLHGGDVAVESTEGVGSLFAVKVPYGDLDPAATPSVRDSSLQAYLDEALQWVELEAEDEGRSPAGATRALVGDTADATILVVDDNPDMRSYLRRMLEPYWRVVVAADGGEALDRVRRSVPDLVLTDVMMPRLDGFGLLEAMRSDPATATVPVVFLSARAGEEAAVEGLGAGADDYLVKPFSGLELMARVRSNLELAALRNRDAAWRAALVDSLQDAVVVLDTRGVLIEANAAFEDTLGYPRSGLPYAPPFPWVYEDVGNPEVAAETARVHARMMEGGRVNAVVPVRHRLGHRLFVAVTSGSVGEGDDRRIVVAFHDVTTELAAADRDAALARLGIGLAEATDVKQVDEAGLSALRRVLGARRAALLVADGTAVGEVAVSGDGRVVDGDLARRVMDGLAEESTVVVPVTGDPTSRVAAGVAALLDPRDRGRAVWLELDPPRALGVDERSLFAVLCAYFGQALHRAQLFEDNRAVATAMQRSILGPTTVPPGLAVRYFPAVKPLEVGGDWYDVVEFDDRRLALVVGDCTGRGLEAATTMGQLRSACRALLLQAKGPAEVVAALDTFAERLPSALCTTVFCAVIDDDADTVAYSSAGHLPALLAGADGGVRRLDGGQGLPLGYLAGGERPQAEAALAPGDTLVLYTDGLVERRRESLDVGLGRLADALADRRLMTPDSLADELLAAQVPDADHEDDIALVVYRRPGIESGPASPLELTVRADPAELARFRRRLREWLAAAGVAAVIANDLLIASGEACANAIEHAYRFAPDGTITVTVSRAPGRVEITVADGGAWREVESGPNRGRGLDIMRSLCEVVEVDRGPEGTTVRLVKELR